MLHVDLHEHMIRTKSTDYINAVQAKTEIHRITYDTLVNDRMLID